MVSKILDFLLENDVPAMPEDEDFVDWKEITNEPEEEEDQVDPELKPVKEDWWRFHRSSIWTGGLGSTWIIETDVWQAGILTIYQPRLPYALFQDKNNQAASEMTRILRTLIEAARRYHLRSVTFSCHIGSYLEEFKEAIWHLTTAKIITGTWATGMAIHANIANPIPYRLPFESLPGTAVSQLLEDEDDDPDWKEVTDLSDVIEAPTLFADLPVGTKFKLRMGDMYTKANDHCYIDKHGWKLPIGDIDLWCFPTNWDKFHIGDFLSHVEFHESIDDDDPDWKEVTDLSMHLHRPDWFKNVPVGFRFKSKYGEEFTKIDDEQVQNLKTGSITELGNPTHLCFPPQWENATINSFYRHSHKIPRLAQEDLDDEMDTEMAREVSQPPGQEEYSLAQIKAAEPEFFSRKTMKWHGTRKVYKYKGNYIVVHNVKRMGGHGFGVGDWTLDEYVIYQFVKTENTPDGFLLHKGHCRFLDTAKRMIKTGDFVHPLEKYLHLEAEDEEDFKDVYPEPEPRSWSDGEPKPVEIPGIDDCDQLYSLTSRDGKDSIYIKTQQADDGLWYYECVIDCNTGGFCYSFGNYTGPFESSEAAALDTLGACEEWFYENDVRFSYDDDLKKIIRRFRRQQRKLRENEESEEDFKDVYSDDDTLRSTENYSLVFQSGEHFLVCKTDAFPKKVFVSENDAQYLLELDLSHFESAAILDFGCGMYANPE